MDVVDALPVTKPTVLKHWRKCRPLNPASKLASSFLPIRKLTFLSGCVEPISSADLWQAASQVLTTCWDNASLRARCVTDQMGNWACANFIDQCSLYDIKGTLWHRLSHGCFSFIAKYTSNWLMSHRSHPQIFTFKGAGPNFLAWRREIWSMLW